MTPFKTSPESFDINDTSETNAMGWLNNTEEN